MIEEITNEVNNAINEVFKVALSRNATSFVLLIGRADVIPELKCVQKTKCVIDYELDRVMDETREHFYLRYMNRRYKKEGFNYDGEEGINDLFVEMMIYTHLWDSHYFLKTLVRLAGIVSSGNYLWEPNIPINGKWEFMHDSVIKPLKDSNLALGSIVESCYNSDIRNAFAHSLFGIDSDNRTITTHTKQGYRSFSFDEFQRIFLTSVILMNKLQNIQEINHDNIASLQKTVTDPFVTPDGIKVEVRGEMIKRGGKFYPEFRMYILK